MCTATAWLCATKGPTLRRVSSLLSQRCEGQVILRSNLTRIMLVDRQLTLMSRCRDNFIFRRSRCRCNLVFRRPAQVEGNASTRLIPTRLFPLRVGQDAYHFVFVLQIRGFKSLCGGLRGVTLA